MNGKYVDLAEAARLSPGKPHVASVWRWCRRGVKTRSGGRERLEHVRCGGKIFTTEAALQSFFERVAAADAEHFKTERPASTKPPTDRQRERSVAQAEKVLSAGGIL